MSEFQDKTFERVAPGSPERCQMVQHKGGQCLNKKMPNGPYCAICDQGVTNKRESKQNINLFNLARLQERVKGFTGNPKQRTLSDEVGILRILLEDKINSCQNENELQIKAQSIGNMIMQIQQLVIASAKLDQQLNNTLTRSQVDVFGQKIIEILAKHVDPSLLEQIANEIQASIDSL